MSLRKKSGGGGADRVTRIPLTSGEKNCGSVKVKKEVAGEGDEGWGGWLLSGDLF